MFRFSGVFTVPRVFWDPFKAIPCSVDLIKFVPWTLMHFPQNVLLCLNIVAKNNCAIYIQVLRFT
jgi:hypothetical protein